MTPLGHHLLIDMWGCNAAINNTDAVHAALQQAVSAMQAQLLNLHVHAFSPQGVTAVATLAESHFALHSWPECGYLAADVFTCGPPEHLAQAVAVLQDHFEPTDVQHRQLPRGLRPVTRPASGVPGTGNAAVLFSGPQDSRT